MAIVVGGQVLDLLGKRTDASKLTPGWREGIFSLGHGIGSGDDLLFSSGDPEVERLTDREVGLRQGNVAGNNEKQGTDNAKDSFHESSLRTSFVTLKQTHEQTHVWLN